MIDHTEDGSEPRHPRPMAYDSEWIVDGHRIRLWKDDAGAWWWQSTAGESTRRFGPFATGVEAQDDVIAARREGWRATDPDAQSVPPEEERARQL